MTQTTETHTDEPAGRHRHGPPPESLGAQIQANPLMALAAGATIGFVAGGGARSRAGLALLMFVGRIITRDTLSKAIVKAVESHGSRRRAGAY
jgi:hypothetical protein